MNKVSITTNINKVMSNINNRQQRLGSVIDSTVKDIVNIGHSKEKELLRTATHTQPFQGFLMANLYRQIERKGNLVTGRVGVGLTPQVVEQFMYIEYGTGIVGKQEKHEWAESDNYEYDVNKHGYQGWYYPIKGGSGGSKPYARTWGIKPNRFVYYTKLHLNDIKMALLESRMRGW